nr:RHS repeat-associated core domain-containing protein [Serratia nevei]
MGRLSEQVIAHEAKGPTGQTAGGNRLLVRRYRYDASGQLTDINDTRRGQLAYRYDPVGRLLEAQSRLGHETFDFDPASNLMDPAEQREAERQRMPRIKALDNLLKQYAGTHYQYDARGNLTQRWHNGKEGRFTWDLFDRLTHYEDDRLKVDYSYDALGRRLSKHSQAHYEERREAGPHWNRAERVKRNRELQCGFTLYGWDGDTLAWESKIADEDGFGARTTHYVYEPGSFVPVAQAVHNDAIELLDQPEYGDYYRQSEDPLWGPPPPAPPINSLAWYQCDHLGTPQELTDEHSEIAWSAEYRAWGVAQEAIRKASGKAPIANPIRCQGQYHDHESGLHYNRYRYYDPEVGRFVSKDPIGYAGGLNVFQYVPNPTGWIDPLGLASCPCDCEKVLADAGLEVGPHSQMASKTRGTLNDSHHIYQDKAVESLPHYKREDAMTVIIQGRNPDRTTTGTPHYNASRVQNTSQAGGMLGSETVVAFKALRAAGLGPKEAKCATLKARGYLAGLGGSAGSSTKIPKSRRR